MITKLNKIENELYNLINKEVQLQEKKISKGNKDDEYWISFGKTVAFAKCIALIENKPKK